MEKRAIQPNSTRRSFPYKPNDLTPRVPSQPSPIIKAKNQLKNHTKKHKYISTPKRKQKQKT